jgi:hypothetical protein
VRSDDGRVSFTLAPTPSGVFVQRLQLREGTACVIQSALFSDGRSFQRWCDADSVRFDYPLVYMSLKRNGDALFDTE